MAELLSAEWQAELERSGLSPVTINPANETADGVTCPACGTCAPLVDGACSDCGLYLG